MVPSSPSSLRICELSVGWLTWQCSAAREKCRNSSRATRYLSMRRFMPSIIAASYQLYKNNQFENEGGRPDHMLRSAPVAGDRKSTRLNSSHVAISYAVVCLKQKRTKTRRC